MTSLPPRTYPQGVTCWVDSEQPDPDAAALFYAALFGWTFTNAMPPGAPAKYLIAQLDDDDVAAVGSGGGAASWNTYIAVVDADATARAIAEAGGRVLSEPADAGPGGRTATCADPQGAEFRLWQPYKRLGAQTVNVAGSWNFSDLQTSDLDGAKAFYSSIFGWHYLGFGAGVENMVTVSRYGDHLASTADPDIYHRQATAPPGFADVIGAVESVAGAGDPHWQVKFSVADRDATSALAVKLGGSVLSNEVTTWAALAVIRDPQGAEFTISEFRPPT